MAVIVPRDPEIASLPRRTAAGAIDVACAVAAMAAVAGVVMGFVWVRQRSKSFAELIDQLHQGGRSAGISARAFSGGAGTALSIVDRNLRSPGKRAMGLRRVDAASGGPVQMRSVVIASLLNSAVSLLGFHLFAAPRLRRFKQWSAEVEAQRAKLREGPDDERTDERLVYEMIEQDELPERPSCLPAALPLILQWTVGVVAMVRSPRRQTLNQRLAGTIVLRTR
jgi:uncharacterized RDD family membrane protein YckC